MAARNRKMKSLTLETLEARRLMAADLGVDAQHGADATGDTPTAAAAPATGDMNGDGQVRGFDLLAWQRSGARQDDLTGWNANFGRMDLTDPDPADDRFEENDAAASAANLGAVTTAEQWTGLVVADNADWYRFELDRAGGADAEIIVEFEHDLGDVDVRLYNASILEWSRSESTDDMERISLAGLAAGEYFVEVYGYNGVHNPNYSLSIDPGSHDDAYEDNDTFATARDLGTITESETMLGLVMADDVDWYRFTTDRPGDSQSYVEMNFSHAQGDLDMELYNSFGEMVRWSTGATDQEWFSLEGLSGGEYFLGVYGYNGVHNLSYTLDVNPGSAGPISADSTLWLNFDGAFLSNQDMRRWAGSDWAGSVANFDPEGDGLLVQSFLPGYAQRETMINDVIAMVQEDLSPYGIDVRRTNGLAVENVGETTIFIGVNGMQGHNVAGDVDFGNNNLTDIAFVGDGWLGNYSDTLLGMADVVLHEAGHTFGLCHVNTRVNGVALPESMGLRYTAPQNEWFQDTSFMNRTFVEYLNHCQGRGSQNAHQTMLQNFGGAAAPSASEMVRFAANEGGQFVLTASAETDLIEVRPIGGGAIELEVNGHVYQLGAETAEIRIFTDGDARDQIIVADDLNVDVVIDWSPAARMLPGKIDAHLVAVWNGSQTPLDVHGDDGAHDIDVDVADLSFAALEAEERDEADDNSAFPTRPSWSPAAKTPRHSFNRRQVNSAVERTGSLGESRLARSGSEAVDVALAEFNFGRLDSALESLV